MALKDVAKSWSYHIIDSWPSPGMVAESAAAASYDTSGGNWPAGSGCW